MGGMVEIVDIYSHIKLTFLDGGFVYLAVILGLFAK